MPADGGTRYACTNLFRPRERTTVAADDDHIRAAMAAHVRREADVRVPVVILGGGAAGVTAADELYNAGIDFVLLEASDKLGGRLREEQFHGETIEAGAEWVHGLRTSRRGHTNSAWTLVKMAKLRGNLTSHDSAMHLWRDGSVVPASLWQRWKRRLDRAYSACERRGLRATDDNESTGECLARVGYRRGRLAPADQAVAATLEWLKVDFEALLRPDAVALRETVPKNYDPYRGRYDNRDFRVVDRRGYARAVRRLAASFERSVWLSQPAARVEYSADGVTVTTATNKRVHAEYAVCTLPLGVLQSYLDDGHFFSPALPADKQSGLRHMKMGHYAKVTLAFALNFWDRPGAPTEVLVVLGGELQGRGTALTWALNLDHPKYMPGSRMLSFHMSGELALRVQSQPTHTTEAQLLSELRALFPTATRHVRAIGIHVTRWSSDPLTRGSYSTWPVGFARSEWEAMRRPVGRLYFAGEHTADNFGYTHGAVDSGFDAAALIIENRARENARLQWEHTRRSLGCLFLATLGCGAAVAMVRVVCRRSSSMPAYSTWPVWAVHQASRRPRVRVR